MKWLDAPPVRVAQLAATAVCLVLLLAGEPDCAAALLRLAAL